MKKIILAKRTHILAACVVILLVIAFLAQDKEPSFLEVERQKAFERHADTSERARQYFGERYNRLSSEEKQADAILQVLDLPKPVSFEPREDDGRKAIIELRGKYSRLILMWDGSGEPAGYVWEIDTPAADSVSWVKHLESFHVAE